MTLFLAACAWPVSRGGLALRHAAFAGQGKDFEGAEYVTGGKGHAKAVVPAGSKNRESKCQ